MLFGFCNHHPYVKYAFANMGPTQQGKLKQMLSKVKVNGRPIFGKAQADRPRYASFLATTNDEHPLCDLTGSRRYLCLHIPSGQYIDNVSYIDYAQLYAQVIYELIEQHTPYWFSNDQILRIQEHNLSYYKTGDLAAMLKSCFRLPANEGEEEANWMGCTEIFDVLHVKYPMLVNDVGMKMKIGQMLRYMGCKCKHTKVGQVYQLLKTGESK